MSVEDIGKARQSLEAPPAGTARRTVIASPTRRLRHQSAARFPFHPIRKSAAPRSTDNPSMPTPVQIADTVIAPGQRRTVELPIAQLHTHTEMTMPVHVVCGKKTGPRLFVSAAIHGDEINGVEIIHRLLTSPVLNRLRGTLIAVPIVNVFGFINHDRYLPDRRDLNRSFPGSETGSLSSRLAQLFMQHIVDGSTHGIDLHTGSNQRTNLPQIRANLDEKQTATLAAAFRAPVVLNSTLRDGSLRQAVADMNIPMLLYEAGEALRFDEMAIRVGVRGILSVMREIGMLPANRQAKPRSPVVAYQSSWVRAGQSGILRTRTPLGRHVKAGETLAVVSDPFGESRCPLLAEAPGIVIGKTNLPLVNEGDAVFHIAHAKSRPSQSLEQFRIEPDPDLDRLDNERLSNL